MTSTFQTIMVKCRCPHFFLWDRWRSHIELYI